MRITKLKRKKKIKKKKWEKNSTQTVNEKMQRMYHKESYKIEEKEIRGDRRKREEGTKDRI